jgi:hypothetical protein
MKNTYRLIWSLRAVENLKRIIKYLEVNWTDKEIYNFFYRLSIYLAFIEKNPESFPTAKSKLNIRRAVVTKHNTIYFKMKKTPFDSLLYLIQDKTQRKEKYKTKYNDTRNE